MFTVNIKNIRTTSLTSFWCLYCLLQTNFIAFSRASIVDVEHANACWKRNIGNETTTKHWKQEALTSNNRSL